jgi:iron only hydrogenase large subunit-like protein
MILLGAAIKFVWSKQKKIDPKKIFNVALMPCTAKKDEIAREQWTRNGLSLMDAVFSVREFAEFMREKGITNWDSLPEGHFDDPFGEASGAAALFASSGGVMEAALRTAADKLSGESLTKIDYVDLRGSKGIKESKIKIKDHELHIMVVSGLANAQTVLKQIIAGEIKPHFVEIMACPGGCIGGGGQPQSDDPEIVAKRMKGIYSIDSHLPIRKSHENKSVLRLYEEFFESPISHKAHEYLHTHYKDRKVSYPSEKK